jgi:hypothetical protein
MTKQELRTELLMYNRFLYGDVENDTLVDEYLNAIDFKPRASIDDVIKFSYDLYEVPLHSRNMYPEISNSKKIFKLFKAQGQIARYVMENRIKGYTDTNVYMKLFGTRPSRPCELVHIYYPLGGVVDEDMYDKLSKFIDGKHVSWEINKEDKKLEWL